MASVGAAPVQLIRNAYATTNVTTAAYVQLDAALDKDVTHAEIFDSSGSALFLAVGASGSEVNYIYIPPGGNGRIPLILYAGMRLSIKAVDTNATTGQLLITLYR